MGLLWDLCGAATELPGEPSRANRHRPVGGVLTTPLARGRFDRWLARAGKSWMRIPRRHERSQPGVFFTINDSGNDPILFAMDTMARTARTRARRHECRLGIAAIGPCATGAAYATDCVYIGDTGQHARHKTRVYRVREPPTAKRTASRPSFRTPSRRTARRGGDGRGGGDMFFITKRPPRYVTGVLGRRSCFIA